MRLGRGEEKLEGRKKIIEKDKKVESNSKKIEKIKMIRGMINIVKVEKEIEEEGEFRRKRYWFEKERKEKKIVDKMNWGFLRRNIRVC